MTKGGIFAAIFTDFHVIASQRIGDRRRLVIRVAETQLWVGSQDSVLIPFRISQALSLICLSKNKSE